MEKYLVPQKSKIKEIKKLRNRNDSNFIPFKVITSILFVATTIVLLYYLLLFDASKLSEYQRLDANTAFITTILFGYLFAFLSFIPWSAFLSVTPNVVDETFCLKDGVLYRIIHGKTQNTSPDPAADNSEKFIRSETLNLNAVSSCRYDPVTHRVEISGAYQINVDGIKFNKNPFAINKTIVYYDYYEPSLVSILREEELIVKEERIKYRFKQK